MYLGKLAKCDKPLHFAVHVDDHEGQGPRDLMYHVRDVGFIVDFGVNIVEGAKPVSVLECSCAEFANKKPVYAGSAPVEA